MDEKLYEQFITSLNLINNFSTPAQQRMQAEEFQSKFHENENSIEYYLYILSTPFFESGKQPNPHTVSVTKAITPPSFNKILSSSMNELLSNIVSNSFN